MMRTVHLHGRLGRDYGKSFRVSVTSIGEAVRLLAVQIPGLKDAIDSGRFRINLGPKKHTGLLLDSDQISFGLPAGDLHIVPVVRGGKSGGIGKIIIGTLLIAASFFVPVGGSILASIGLSMAISGVSTLLAANKKKEKTKKSYMDSGGQTPGQGGCVPLVIGRFMTTPILISTGVSVADSTGLV